MTSTLEELSRRVRLAESDRELGFTWVNETMALSPYRQAALWLADGGVWALSGVVQVDAHVPYVQWLEAVARHLQAHRPPGQLIFSFTAGDLPPDLAAVWSHWWPAHALWVAPGAEGLTARVVGAGIFVREEPWETEEQTQLQAWSEVWWHAFAAWHRPNLSMWGTWRARLKSLLVWKEQLPWWRQRGFLIALALLLVLLFPVRMTVLAPGELVPAHPAVVRAPIDGVMDVFHVQPNQHVQVGQPLFGFDELVIQARLDTSLQALATAETDFRQTTQMALMDPRAKAQLGLLAGKVEEKRAEVAALREQLTRVRVLSPQAGVVLMDDPVEWIGKPVATGERILRIASLDDVEVEAWIPLADAIRLEPGDAVSLYLSASPLAPVTAHLRYMAHDAVQRPDGSFAYRVRATLDAGTAHRVGLKGTAKLHGSWVPFVYWMMRRPWATARAYLGW